MFKKIVPFNTQAHANKKVKPVNTFNFIANTHVVALMANEMSRAAHSFPVVFLKEGENYGLYALMGLKQNENLFVDSEGKWETSAYIPAIIRRYPFALGKGQPDSDQFMICIDEESDFLSENEGEPLVTDGKPGPIIEKAKGFLTELYRSGEVTTAFCKALAERDLFSPLNMQLKDKVSGVTQNITGCYAINEKKISEMPDEDFLALRKRGFLPLIYAHTFSLTHIERLVRIQGERNKK
ncbi:peptidase [Desulfonema ishimotonii]|uniref:Peptidase n=1 Tax=Desulfonema ishimotonii TaxID=45657 RepID=A0A401FXK3_9BACT|nr:SapC family protein [Desulfonema ishimotonii]GBC61691.1 peptidase [Desulfonema ishimotonii]